MGMFVRGAATAKSETQGTPCVAVLSDFSVCGDVERGKKAAWSPARGSILEAEPGFSALSLRAHGTRLRCEPQSGNL